MPINRAAAQAIKEFNNNREQVLDWYIKENGIIIIEADDYCRGHNWKKIEATLDLWQCSFCQKFAISDSEPLSRNQVYLICHQLILDAVKEKKYGK